MNSQFMLNATSFSISCHPLKHFHQSRPVDGVGCGENSNTVPMEYTINCQYTCDHYVIVTPTHRDTQTEWHCYCHWTSHTWIDLIGLRVDTFTETGSQQGTNRPLGGSSHLREITKISAIHCRFTLERKTIFHYVFSLDDPSHIHRPKMFQSRVTPWYHGVFTGPGPCQLGSCPILPLNTNKARLCLYFFKGPDGPQNCRSHWNKMR